MADFSPIVAPTNLIQAQAAPASTAELATRSNIRKSAEEFEASFLSIMLQQMFKDVQTSKPFGGGDGEEMFKSFMTDAFAKQMAKSGGIGLADTVGREMLKLQGLE
ncbi:MAG: rod-binding protein [Phenylobacterium sp.]|uniref:rod-binding protein n=1 Tax=Phenylobacterium sp. TaxID=1871053 RepID=UPI00391DCEB6